MLSKLGIRLNGDNAELENLYPYKGKLIMLSKMSSKMFREERIDKTPTCVFKCGLILTPHESINYMNKVKKITSVRSKNFILRCLHGEIYTNERLNRFGLTNDPYCQHCGQDDTLIHRLSMCTRSLELIRTLEDKTKDLRLQDDLSNEDLILRAMGGHNSGNTILVTLHAELLAYINSTKNEPPERVVTRIISNLIRKEKNEDIKDTLRTLLTATA